MLTKIKNCIWKIHTKFLSWSVHKDYINGKLKVYHNIEDLKDEINKDLKK